LPSPPAHNFEPPQEDLSGGGKRVGICLQPAMMPAFSVARPAIGWVEIHAENCMAGGAAMRALASIRCDYEVSLHSVGLSLGSPDGLQTGHLQRIASLNAALQPGLVSDHLSWSTTRGMYLNALLPLPYTGEALDVVCRNIDAVQTTLGREILVENVSAYVRFRHSEIPEAEFLMEAARRTGCGILCDVNNLFVNCANFGGDPLDYLRAISPAAVRQIHLGGHSRVRCGDDWLLFDEHGARVDHAVWELYRAAVRMFGARLTVVEWDTRPLSLAALLDEARLADAIMVECSGSPI
jgi:uncharacterized protein (UPF0276 family)